MLSSVAALGWEYAVILILGVLLCLGIVATFADLKTRRLAAAARKLREIHDAGEGDVGAVLDELPPNVSALAREAAEFDAHPAWVMPESVCVETRPIHGILGMLAAVLTLIAIFSLPLAGTGDAHTADVNRMLIAVFGGIIAAVLWTMGYFCRRRAHAVYEKFCAALSLVLCGRSCGAQAKSETEGMYCNRGDGRAERDE